MRYINIYDLQLLDIELFLKIAECGSFTKAGHQLFLTQSLVSKRINALEQKLGLQLFIRNKRQVNLTPAGRILKRSLGKINEDIFKAIKEAHNVQLGITGIVRLGFIEWGNLFFMHILEEFMNENPQIYLEIKRYSFSELRNNLMSSDIDIGFTISYDIDNFYNEEYNHLEMVKIPMVAILNKKNRLAKKEVVTIFDLQAEDLLMVNPKYSKGYYDCIYDLFSSAGIKPNISHYAQSGGDHIGNLLLDRGVLIASKYFLENSWKEQIVQVPITDTSVSIVAIWKKTNINAGLEILTDKMIGHYK